ncbi:hypothetical protein [Bacillus alkalicellulosilyticus]|nr:hypothetical protein [Bacillus alkalicellulosilyticus]
MGKVVHKLDESPKEAETRGKVVHKLDESPNEAEARRKSRS